MEKNLYESEYDEYFEKSDFIKFYPFIGTKYKNCSSKLLILGESHYINPDSQLTNEKRNTLNNDKYSTRSVFLDEYFYEIRENGTHPFQWVRCYRNTAAMITGKEYHCSDYVWDKLSFYNFFQEHVGSGAKGKEFINETLIQDSRKAYEEVLKILKPNLVIAWGINELYENWVPQDNCEIINYDSHLYTYTTFPDITFWHIRHPSQGFSYADYHEEFLQVLKKINLDISCVLKE